MLIRMRSAAGVLAGAALLCSTMPAHAIDVIGIAPLLESFAGTTITATCTVKPSGLSLDASSNPYYVAGVATVISSQVPVSIALRCRLRYASSGSQVGAAQQLAMAGNTVAVAGVIPVSTVGPFKICTSVSVVFSDSSRIDTSESCLPVVGS